MLGGGRVFHRDRERRIVGALIAREFARSPGQATIGADTIVFDTTVTSAAAYRTAFEKPLRDSWHRELLATAGRR